MRNRAIKRGIVILCLTAVVGQLSAQVLYAEKDNETKKWGYRSKAKALKLKTGVSFTAKDFFNNIGSAMTSTKSLKKATANYSAKPKDGPLPRPTIPGLPWAIAPQYDAVQKEFNDNLAAVVINGKLGFIDVNNRIVIAPQFENTDELDGFAFGLAAVKSNGLYGFINKKGEWVIEPRYEYASNFKDNYLAPVKESGKYGAIDLKGDIVVPYKYKVELAMTTIPVSSKEYKEAAKDVEAKKNRGAYDDILKSIETANREVNAMQNISPQGDINGYESTGTGNNKGLSDKYGRVIVPEQFDAIDVSNGLTILVSCNGHKGLYSAYGREIIPPLFDTIENIDTNGALVSIGGVSGNVNMDGNADANFINSLNEQAIKLAQANKPIESLRLFEAILHLDPTEGRVANNMAFLYFAAEQDDMGHNILSMANKIAPDNKVIAENQKLAKKAKDGVGYRLIGDMFVVADTHTSVIKQSVDQEGIIQQHKDAVQAGATSATVSTGGMSAEEYQAIYDRWANKAKQCYDAYKKGTDKETNEKGFQNYKKLMNQTKSDAALEGITLTKSEVEELMIE